MQTKWFCHLSQCLKKLMALENKDNNFLRWGTKKKTQTTRHGKLFLALLFLNTLPSYQQLKIFVNIDNLIYLLLRLSCVFGVCVSSSSLDSFLGRYFVAFDSWSHIFEVVEKYRQFHWQNKLDLNICLTFSPKMCKHT